MRTLARGLVSSLLAIAFAVAIVGCSQHRYYDSYHNDYHVWDQNEAVYYSRWEHDTHRDHKDFKRRSAAEQKEYWDWRHNQH